MTRSQRLEKKRAANIVGAFALALTDKMVEAVRAAGGCSDMTSAALIQIGCFEPGLSIERLRTNLGLSHSATVRLIDAAQTSGLVKRERDVAGDSRVAVLTLTSAGHTRMREMLAARAGVTEAMLARLSADEVTTLLAILEKTIPAVVRPGPDLEIVCRLCDLDSCPQDRCPITACDQPSA